MPTNDKASVTKDTLKDLSLGAIAGAAATAAIMPLDNLADEYKLRHSRITDAAKMNASTERMKALKSDAKISTILKEFVHSPRMAYRSLPLKMLKIAPATALQFYIYNQLKNSAMFKKEAAKSQAAVADEQTRIAKYLALTDEQRAALLAQLANIDNQHAAQNAAALKQLSTKLQGEM